MTTLTKHLTIGLFIFLLIGKLTASAGVNLSFSHERGIYEHSFDLSIRANDPSAVILYTLDGSNPLNSESTVESTVTAIIEVNPFSKTGRAATAGVVVRACAISQTDTSKVETNSYLFLSEVKNQGNYSPELAPYWPTTQRLSATYDPNLVDWMRGDFQYYNFDVSPAIVSRTEYFSQFEDALKSLPILSLSTDPKNLFDEEIGIYRNSTQPGRAWERPGSIELFNTGNDGFQVNTGIRIRGGWSSTGNFTKHSFRLFFREEYGDSKLNYPLFEDEGTDSFDKIDLRSSQNNSWHCPSNNPKANYIHDAFSRDTQGEMGEYYTRSRYYHLFLNGMYWGLYQTQERAEARFAESYMGGNKDDYDVVKSSAGSIDWPPYTLEATDGNLNSSQNLWQLAKEGFNTENYTKARGLNPDGTPNPDLTKYLDVNNLIDYMMIIYFSGNQDGPGGFNGDTRINNFFGIFNRKHPDGFKYFIHDNESAFYNEEANIVNKPTTAGEEFEGFNPAWLHQQLIKNDDYKQTFADRAYKYLTHNGVLTESKNDQRFRERRNQIDQAIIGESARWGNVTATNYTRNDYWLPAVDWFRDTFFPARSQILLEQFREAGWMNEIEPPEFDEAEFDTQETGVFLNEESFQLINPNTTGSIYFTTNNKDPRESGGTIASEAVQYSSEITADQTLFLKARVKNGDQWSPLTERIIVVNQFVDLKITEISYCPLEQVIGSDTIQSKSLEFIEIKNLSGKAIDLSGYSLATAVDYTFPMHSKIDEDSLIVIAADSTEFKKLYGFAPYGQFNGYLNNSGETILLNNPFGQTIDRVDYNKDGVWYSAADGAGYTLVPALSSNTQNQSLKTQWRVSTEWFGSPGKDDPEVSTNPPRFTEVLANTQYPNTDAIELYNPNNSEIDLGNWFISDEKDHPDKWKIPEGTTIPANGYLLFRQGHYVDKVMEFNKDEFGSAFALAKEGERLYLYSGGLNGKPGHFISDYAFEATLPGVSYGEYVDLAGQTHNVLQKSQTPGAKNLEARQSPVVFSSIMYHPFGENSEFIVLKNRTDSLVNLYHQTDKSETWKIKGIDFNFPPETSLDAGDSLYLVEKAMPELVFRKLMTLSAAVQVFNYNGKLKNSSETLSIQCPVRVNSDSVIKFAYTTLETVKYSDETPWPTSADGEGYALQRINTETFANISSNWSTSFKALPFADAGKNQRVRVNESITLDGSKSEDPQGLPLSYSWMLVSGPEGSNAWLTGANEEYPTIRPDTEGNYVFALSVNNGSTQSAAMKVSVYAYNNNTPIVKAHGNKIKRIQLNETAFIDGDWCYDPDYEAITYQWILEEKPAESNIEAPGAVSHFDFHPDVVGKYIFSLVVNDGEASSNPLKYTIIVSNPTGTANVTFAELMLVYPNPVRDRMVVRLRQNQLSDVSLTLLDRQGKTIFSRHYQQIPEGLQEIKLNLSEYGLTKGLYFIRIQNKESVYSQKVMYMR